MANNLQSTVSFAGSKVVHAVDRLHSKFPASLPIEDVTNYVLNSAERQNSLLMKAFKQMMRKSPNVAISNVERTYRYKPPYDIRSSQQLIAYFQSQTTTGPISVADLKKGWADCDPAIDILEKEHKVIVVRNKKENTPRAIWADDASLFAPLEQEFVDLWNGIQLPSKDDVITFLVKSGRTPAGQIMENKAVATTKQKARKSRQSTKRTNNHMTDLFKDYSDKRQKGK